MMNRYRNRKVFKNNLEQYSQIFRKRNVKFIQHYSTPKFNYLNAADYVNIKVIEHVWKEGDRFYKLAEQYYNDPRDWWVIAKFNLTPTESHLEVGNVIQIPTPLDIVLEYMTG